MENIVIIGAGIIGAATAYELTKNGASVTIIDSHEKGRATSAAAGIICPWITRRRNKAWYELARKGAAHMKQLIDNLEADGETETGYKKVGAIRLHADRENLLDLKETALERRKLAPEMGEISLLDKEETMKKFPLLNGNYYSLFVEGAARVDGRSLRESLISAAKKQRAVTIKGEAELITEKNNIVGVKVNNELIKAGIVIATNGVWMPRLLEPLHIQLNIHAQKGEIVHLRENTIETASLPVVMPPNNQYILNFPNGKTVIGATHQNTKDFDIGLTAGGMQYMLNEALQVAPGLNNCTIEETRVGFRPFTYNHLPVFGPVPSINGLFLANGLGASGLTTGPFIGKQLANLILNKEVDVNLENYNVAQAIQA